MNYNRILRILRHLHLISGVYVLLCIPGIFLAEANDWQEAPLHISQMLAVLVCFITSLVYIMAVKIERRHGKNPNDRPVSLAWFACIATGLWIGICIIVLGIWGGWVLQRFESAETYPQDVGWAQDSM